MGRHTHGASYAGDTLERAEHLVYWTGVCCGQVPVLFALREPQLFELARCMRNHAVAAGQVVFRQGDPGGTLVFRQGLLVWLM